MKETEKNNNLFLLKLFSVSSLGIALRSVFGFISQKLLAIYLGPEGLAFVGNFRNVLSLYGLSSTFGVDQGVIVLHSQLEGKTNERKSMLSTTLAYGVIGNVLAGLILLFGASYWSDLIFKSKSYNYLFYILAFQLPFMALYNFCMAVINGKSDYKKATMLSVISGALVTAVVISLVFFYYLSGVLLALTLTPILQFSILLIFAKEELKGFYKLKIFLHPLFKNKLLVFSLISFAAVMLNNFVEIALRNYIINKLSIQEAGYWTAMLNVSNYYLSFLAGLYSLYILPKYAKVKTLKEFKMEYFKVLKIIGSIFIFLLLAIYVFRKFIISLLYTDVFIPMESLFKWQLLGDGIRIVSVLLAYWFIAIKDWKVFVLTEIISYVLFFVFSVLYIEKMGVQGIVFGHFLRYVVYFPVVILFVKYTFEKNK